MEANGLMVGNYLKNEGIIVQIDARSIFDMFSDNPKYSPIILTDEWLVKFGFEKHEYYKQESFEKDFVEVWIVNGKLENDCNKEVKYVHQLQNLYFALTGQELTITKKQTQ